MSFFVLSMPFRIQQYLAMETIRYVLQPSFVSEILRFNHIAKTVYISLFRISFFLLFRMSLFLRDEKPHWLHKKVFYDLTYIYYSFISSYTLLYFF